MLFRHRIGSLVTQNLSAHYILQHLFLVFPKYWI